MATAEAREWLRRLHVEGQNLYGQAAGPMPEAARRLRSAYLRWHDQLLEVLYTHVPDEAARFETARWRLLVGGQVADDELVRTALGDLRDTLGRLQELIGATPAVPERVLAAPATVGVAVYDANCLFSKHTRYVLLGLAVHGVVAARWSRDLLEEAAGTLARKLRGDSLEDLGRWMKAEAGLVRDGLVTGYKRWVDRLDEMPDPDDRHVLAAAIEAGATWIVTSNLRDFPADVLARYGVTAVSPDDFVLACIDANPVLALRVVEDHPDSEWLLDCVDGQLPMAVQALRELGA